MLMDLVEVIMTEHTPDSVADTAEALVDSFGKTPIRCKVDVPSFIVNRLMRPYGEEPAWMAYRGTHSFEEIDSAMKYAEGFPMGPFELADFTGGIQIRVEGEADHLEDDRPMSYDTAVCPIIHQLYEKGRYGRKTDAGYYEYDERDEPHISVDAGQGFDTLLVWAPIINEAAKLVENGVASVEDIDIGARLGGNWPMGPREGRQYRSRRRPADVDDGGQPPREHRQARRNAPLRPPRSESEDRRDVLLSRHHNLTRPPARWPSS